MIGRGIFDRDIVIFQREEYAALDNGRIVIIEKIGEEEGYGAWALKKIVIEKPRSSERDEYGEERDWNDPIIKLESSNPRVHPWHVDSSGQHRVRGVFRRRLSRDEVRLVDSQDICRRVFGLEQPSKKRAPRVRKQKLRSL